MTPAEYEHEVMAHRYLYYVLSDSVLSDVRYDHLERKARSVCDSSSPVHRLGSSLPSDYTAEHIAHAGRMLE